MTLTIPTETIAFVTPRFGPGVVGGAEAVMADAAFGLAARGLPIEILTTCARDHFTWANEFPAGATEQTNKSGSSLTVRRFPVERDTPGRDRDRIGDRILAGADVSIQDQQLWVNDSLRSSGLWDHVFDYGERYRALIFAPYMFWTTYAVSAIRPERSIIMPCLHDEPPAYLELFSSMMRGARGIWSLTEPERELAERLYSLPERRQVVGASVTVPDTYDPDAFRKRFGIDGGFLYFAGRREWGKGWDDLLSAYGAAVEQRGNKPILPLVTSGVGKVEIPSHLQELLQDRVIDVGLLDDRQRDNAMKAASAYIQPSAMESFSRTVLEAMAAGTPVIANNASDVVAWHLERSGAGLTYEDQAELIQCLDFVTDEPLAASALASGGRDYVEANYQLERVLDRMVASLDAWLPAPDLASGWPAKASTSSRGRADLRLVASSEEQVLMVSPFAPYRDGLATYAVQELRKLRSDGQQVSVLSPQPSAARLHHPLGGPVGMARLLNQARNFDRVIIQFGPEMLFGRCRSAADRVAVWSALAALARLRPLDIRLHEIEYGPLEQNPFERRLARQVLLSADRVTVHTRAERMALEQRLGSGLTIEVIEHGRDFVASIQETKQKARAELGLDPRTHILLSIGFLQYHKGFDLAIDAFGELTQGHLAVASGAAQLHIVGSARVDHPEISAYVDLLSRRCAQLPNAFLHQRFTSDVEFDRWLQAADTVVLPYREIWSSGVVERARLFNVPLVVGDLPQLRDQAPEGTLFASDVEQLVSALRQRVDGENETNDDDAGSVVALSEGHAAASAQLVVAAVVEAESRSVPYGPLRAEQRWEIDPDGLDRRAIQRQVALRARQQVGESQLPSDARPATRGLAAMGPLARPEPVSARPGVTTVKRVLNRLMSWQIDPLATRIEELQRATTDAVAQLESSRSVDLTDDVPTPSRPDSPSDVKTSMSTESDSEGQTR